jgi:hypothetical protein
MKWRVRSDVARTVQAPGSARYYDGGILVLALLVVALVLSSSHTLSRLAIADRSLV